MNRIGDWFYEHLGWVLIAIIGLLVWFVVACFQYDEKHTYPEAYQAWLKMGGSTNVSYSEWRAYVSATRPTSITTVTPIYMGR